MILARSCRRQHAGRCRAGCAGTGHDDAHVLEPLVDDTQRVL